VGDLPHPSVTLDQATMERMRRLIPGPAQRDLVLGQAKAVSDPTRLAILSVLRYVRALPGADFCHILQVSQSSISRHLRILAGVGLVESYWDRHYSYYRLTERGKRLLTAIQQANDGQAFPER
jgi:DNA-binding transcriptional ArsR family regulator